MFVVLFSGRRSGSTLRIDLPDGESPHETAQFLDGLCSLLRGLRPQHGSSAPAIVISSAQSFAEAEGHPWRRLARRLERRLAREGEQLRELCCIAPDAWVSYLDPAAPRLGRSLEEITASPLAPAEDSVGLDELGLFETPDEEEAAAVSALLDAMAEFPRTASDAELAASLVAAEEPEIETVAGIVHASGTEAGWFSIVEQLCATAEAFRSAEAAEHRTSEQRFAAMDRLRLASERLARIAPLAPAEVRQPVIAACAFAWWLRGLQSVAHRQICEGIELNTGHETLRIVRRIIDGGQIPPMPREE